MPRIQPPSFFSLTLRVILSVIIVFSPGLPLRAGDILRRNAAGSSTSTTATATAGGGVSTAPSANTLGARDSLRRASAVASALATMQQTVHDAASTKADALRRLPKSALTPATNGLWVNANPLEKTDSSTYEITQNNQQAYLEWSQFDLAYGDTLRFDQSAGGSNANQWIAFNYVRDPSGKPSQIFGSIKAEGQVYILNANGILFGGTAQVNTHALVASSLPINPVLLQRGLLVQNTKDVQFLFDGVTKSVRDAVAGYSPNQTTYASDGSYGKIEVQAGAVLEATDDVANHSGGRIVLIGSNVTNAGTIRSNDGQTILAAGLQVGLVAHNSADATLRGLDAYIGRVSDDSLPSLAEYAGVVENSCTLQSGALSGGGLIEAMRGSVFMAGKTVNQNGAIDSSTSVAFNGRVDLVADYGAVSNSSYDTVQSPQPFLLNNTGVVTLGQDSVIRILPELSSDERVVGTQLALSSIVNIQGLAIHSAANSLILAPGADKPADSTKPAIGLDLTTLSSGVTLNAGEWFNDKAATAAPGKIFSNTSGQIYFDKGASIDVSGSLDVTAPVTENIISVQLLGSELADSPIQKTGALRGQTVQVDIRQTGIYNGKTWVGTPLADTKGYVDLIQRTAGELTINGGSVALNAGDSVVMQKDSFINVSGSAINYLGGYVQTSKVLWAGHLIDISKATPDQIYDGIYSNSNTVTDSKWGVSKTYVAPLVQRTYEGDYVQGGNGGRLTIMAPTMALDGSLLGTTITGSRQRLTSPPTASSLSLVFKGQDKSVISSLIPTLNESTFYSPNPPSIQFKQPDDDTEAVSAFSFGVDQTKSANPADLKIGGGRGVVGAELDLSPDLVNKNGFGNITIDNSDGSITVPEGISLNAATGGSLTLSAKNIDILGSVTIPNGRLSFTVYDRSPYADHALPAGSFGPVETDATRGLVTLGAGSLLSTAGLQVDDRSSSSTKNTRPLLTSGGSVTIKGYNIKFTAGSAIDVSGGVFVNAAGKPTFGDAGAIEIDAGTEFVERAASTLVGGKLTGLLDANLTGYAGVGKKAGKLTVQAPLIQIGGSVLENTDSADLDTTRTIWLNRTGVDGRLSGSDFFSQGGFGSFALNGIGVAVTDDSSKQPSVLIASATTIAPQVQSWETGFDAEGQIKLTPGLPPFAGSRSPVNLTFGTTVPAAAISSTGIPLILRGDVVMGEGAVIDAGPGGSVTLKGSTVAVLGEIHAAGGTITVSGGDTKAYGTGSPQALFTVDMGAKSFLDTRGTTVLIPDTTGRNYRTGSVLKGGKITVEGNILAEKGATLDVSGASGELDMLPAYGGGTTADGSLNVAKLVPTQIESNGGSISLSGTEELFTDATLVGEAGGPSAQGGSLTISSGRFRPDTVATTATLDTVLTVTQERGSALPSLYNKTGLEVVGSALTTGVASGHFAADSLNEAGFDSLALNVANGKGTVEFLGKVDISIQGAISVGNGGAIKATDNTTLSAAYVKIGADLLLPGSPAALDAGTLPHYGAGNLKVQATHLIDIGPLSLQNIGTASFAAPTGDIRGSGTLDIVGSVELRAGQIYVPTAASFTIAAYDDPAKDLSGASLHSGTVTIASGSTTRSLPLSAGGTLNVFASNISQGGVLRAPIGTINLGWDGTGAAPTDPLTGTNVPIAQSVELLAGSITSVSAIDPVTGNALVIPYGVNLNGTAWIDPLGTDITSTGNGTAGVGVPAKAINIAAKGIVDDKGSVIDLTGGGDLFAYRWVSGVGGKSDILVSPTSFAVILGYQADYAPLAGFKGLSDAQIANLGSDVGYLNTTLSVGDQVYLGATDGLPAGTYTLLPARYALLPGAFLVTPKSGVPTSAVAQADGSTLVSGYRFNDLNATRTGQPLYSSFEIAPLSVVKARAQYDESLANTFLSKSALDNNLTVPRLPVDAGQLGLEATNRLELNGKVSAQLPTGGRGSRIDISSVQDILIAGASADLTTIGKDTLQLDSAGLSAFGAESLLIGGRRSADGTVSVSTAKIKVDNSGAGQALTAPEIILVAKDSLTLAEGSDIEQKGSLSGLADTLVLGSVASDGTVVSGSGDGTLLRVSSDPTAQIVRKGVTPTSQQSLKIASTVGKITTIAGASVTLDTTNGFFLDSSTSIKGQSVALDSYRISLQLDPSAVLQSSPGLVLSGAALQTLQASAQSLSLGSYSSLDIYGSDTIGGSSVSSLTLHTPEIRGFSGSGLAGGAVTFVAKSISLDNSLNGTKAGVVLPTPSGSLTFDAGDTGTIQLGSNTLAIDQYKTVALKAGGGLLLQGTGGLSTQEDLTITTPLITGTKAADQTLTAGGNFTIMASGAASTLESGLGAKLTLTGKIVTVNSAIKLPSGMLTLHALTGDVTVGGSLDVSGAAKSFYDLVKYTSGGQITLTSDTGAVVVGNGGTLNVAAPLDAVKNDGATRQGNAGTLTVSAINPTSGRFIFSSTSLSGQGGVDGQGGTFLLDVGALASTSALDAALNSGGFILSRVLRVRNSDVAIDGSATAHAYNLSADQGSITVTGTIDASGKTGGTINLEAYNSLVLKNGARLNVAGDYYDDAGKGGAVSLETRGHEIITGNQYTYDVGAQIDLQTGSTIDLSIKNNLSTTDVEAGNSVTIRRDLFTGTLHLRAPQIAKGTDFLINTISSNIISNPTNPSSIVVEGYNVFDLTSTSASTITSLVQTNVFNNGTTFANAVNNTGDLTRSGAVVNRLLVNNASLIGTLHVRPGAEIVNPSGDLTLDKAWDLSTFRFGPENEPGILTLRAAGSLNFSYNSTSKTYGSLSDGFVTSTPTAINPAQSALWQATLMPAGSQSYAYRLVAGADFTAADFRRVQPLAILGTSTTTGSLLLGKNALALPITPTSVTRSAIIPLNYQVIRTGTGDIDIYAGRDVQLLNPLATIYTAGTQVANPTTLYSAGDFDLPNTLYVSTTTQPSQQNLSGVPVPQYSFAGGNVTISAQNDIIRQFVDPSTGKISADSSKEMPTNWLYRRGYVNSNGLFGSLQTSAGSGVLSPSEVASTSWWVDFTNFFQDVGALGGGNVSLIAGGNVTNVDAVLPTNARMPGKDSEGKVVKPEATQLVELGGGSLIVRAGGNIDGGVYYVERGEGVLDAGANIQTNATRSTANSTNKLSWLPTTLFLGKGSYNIAAKGDTLMGSVVNPFLLPGGINNSYFQRTYFSTFAPWDTVNVSSLTGDVTIRNGVNVKGASGSLADWYGNILLNSGTTPAAKTQPWLRLSESSSSTPAVLAQVFKPAVTFAPGTLSVEAFSGDVDLLNNFTLSPSTRGSLEILAAKSINGFQLANFFPSLNSAFWAESKITLADADPKGIPGVASPLFNTYYLSQPLSKTLPSIVEADKPVPIIATLADDVGATTGSAATLQIQQALHGKGPADSNEPGSQALHGGDTESLHLYAGSGDISGITLIAAKAARISAGNDITDVGFYLQNARSDDVSVVAAGRDIIAYNINSDLRTLAGTAATSIVPQSGDIQIAGPGTLEVFAGRNLDLGTPPPSATANGTAVGITSIGNTRNPYLPSDGADVVVGAGLFGRSGVNLGNLDFAAFIARYLNPGVAHPNPLALQYLPELGQLMGLASTTSIDDIWKAYQALGDDAKGDTSVGQRDRLALDIFYLVLRNAGRDHNDASKSADRNYEEGYAAIATLFPGDNAAAANSQWANAGNILLSSRSIQTTNGGNISLFAPGGGLSLGYTLPKASTAIDAPPPTTPGIVTQRGGNIYSFTRDKVDLGVFRIFTLRGGNEIIWSSLGDIAAGVSSKTVQAAPPTRVLVDQQSADVKTDLAGLATGGGIGVLATVAGVTPGNVDLIAPKGTIDAGDAGIRSSGNLNIAAAQVLNASNIQVAGTSAGTPPPAVVPSVGNIASASSSAAGAASSASETAKQQQRAATQQSEEVMPSIIQVEVLGYGGGEGDEQLSAAKKKSDQG